MTLQDQRVLFSNYVGQLIRYAQSCQYVLDNRYLVALDEGRVLQVRKDVHGQEYVDNVHTIHSWHYKGLAQDLVAWKSDLTPVPGSDPLWGILAEFWKSLNPACTPGYNFTKQDPDHFSLGEGEVV